MVRVRVQALRKYHRRLFKEGSQNVRYSSGGLDWFGFGFEALLV